ncbi:phage minor head protein [Paenibacillus sp. FSL R5-0908]|uniref:phage minor head protein n=1 Tax=Paenibacillus sp. FSL R5-0908 TaxID=2921664 RepID=UPI0030F87FF7
MADRKNPYRPGTSEYKAWNMANQMDDMLEETLAKHQAILDKRSIDYGKLILPTWRKVETGLLASIKELYAKYAGPDGKLMGAKLTEAARLQELQRMALGMIRTLEGQADLLENHIAFTYVDSVNFNTWALEQATNITVATPVLTYPQVMGVIANPWLPDGKTYSDRIRANTANLALKMDETILQATTQGWDLPKTARKVRDEAGESYDRALTLARTEMNRAASLASSHSFIQNSDILGGKRWVATLDIRTAPKDADNDGKIYDVAYDTPEMPGTPGQRIPNHPNCRCKYSPVVDGMSKKIRERIARGDGDTLDNYGQRYYTKAQTYREYAKERGLPDLDERLAKDNPKKYLRRGEKAS